MFSTKTRVRAVAITGMAVVATGVGAVTYQASAAEVATPATAADARAVAIPIIPAAIKPPEGSRPIGAYIVVTGTQTYKCTGGIYETKSTPEAQLIGTGGRIHHFAGPSWQSERDGSLVTATPVPGASVPRAGTIPELLLQVTGRQGQGILDKADYINRLFTSGGAGPTGSCTSPAVVPYKAVYVFWDAP